jgi:predicted porin
MRLQDVLVALIVFVCLCIPGSLLAADESDSSADEVEDFLGNFNPYGRFLIHAALASDEVEIQNSASWVGLQFSVGDRIKTFAQVEWGVNLVKGTQLNLGASTVGGFVEFSEDPTEVFGARLGLIGVDLGRPGRIAIGKQHSPHYDIAGFTTDRWNVFGGQGSLAYPAHTDGGNTGTGRADQVVTYRVNLFKIFDLGAQVQFSNATNDRVSDGYGVSARVTVIRGLVLGIAYTLDSHGDFVREEVTGIDGDGEYLIGGAKYTRGILQLGAVVCQQNNGDLVRFEGVLGDPDDFVPLVFDGTGLEVFAKVRLGDFAPVGGLVLYEPESDSPLLADDFRTRYAILGAEWYMTPSVYLYGEWRIDDSITHTGEAEPSILTLGLRYGFSGRGEHGEY